MARRESPRTSVQARRARFTVDRRPPGDRDKPDSRMVIGSKVTVAGTEYQIIDTTDHYLSGRTPTYTKALLC